MILRSLLIVGTQLGCCAFDILPPPMGWLRLVGSLKLQVSFVKETYKRDDILQKRPIILRSLLIVATPYVLCFLVVGGCVFVMGWLRLVGSLKL